MALILKNRGSIRNDFLHDEFLISLEELRPQIKNIIATGTQHYYTQYKLKKRSGKGYRTISAPNDELKQVQRSILRILQGFYLAFTKEHVFGFVPGRTVADNAIYHRRNTKLPGFKGYHRQLVKRKILATNNKFVSYSGKLDDRLFCPPTSLVRLDIANAFDSVGYSLLKKNWPNNLTISQEDFDLIIEICTLNGTLPQGAPTSPILLNIALCKFDKYCQKVIKRRLPDAKYSRFADDITVSCTDTHAKKSIPIVVSIARTLGLRIKKKKTKIMTKRTGLFVNGINIVNSRHHVCTSRRSRAKIRAAIHQASLETDPVIKETLCRRIVGRITYVTSLDETHGVDLLSYAVFKKVLPQNQKIIGKTFSSQRTNIINNKQLRKTIYE